VSSAGKFPIPIGGKRVALLAERLRLGFGADRVVHEFALALTRAGYRVTVFVLFADETYTNYPYEVRRLAVPHGLWFSNTERRARRHTKSLLLQRFDVFVVFTFPFFALAPELARHKPCIAFDMGVSPSDGMPLRLRMNIAGMRRALYRRHLPHATHVLTISDFLKRSFPTQLRARTQVIHLGVDHIDYGDDEDRERTRSALGLNSSSVLGLYVGRLNPDAQPYKGTAELCAMAEQLRSRFTYFRMLFVGFGSEADAAWLETHGHLHRLNAPPEEMAGLLAAADVFLTATRWEGFDLPVGEAQHAGLPVVCYHLGAHPEVVAGNQSGFLVESRAEFEARASELIADSAIRQRMGLAARAFAMSHFPWLTAHEAFVACVREAASNSEQSSRGSVSAVVVNYRAERERIETCVRTLLLQKQPPDEILIVDNGSLPGSLDRLCDGDARVIVLPMNGNAGFARAVNTGVEAAQGEYILVSNFDVEYEPDALRYMTEALHRDPEVIGVAPKTLLLDSNGVIDNVGNALTPNYEPFNLGIGQPDFGQYDRPERVFGLCFAAALIRKSAFDLLGGLDETFFMYMEDVEWCHRVNSFGGEFRSCPDARVHHVHSEASRQRDESWKYGLIHGNLLRFILQSRQGSSAYRLIARRLLGSARAAWRGSAPRRGVALAAWRFLVDVPRRLIRRRRFQPARSVGDDGFLWLSLGEAGHFDPATYRSIPSPAMLRDIARRQNLHDPSPERLAILLATDELVRLGPRVGPEQVLAALESLPGAETFVAYWREIMKDRA
jgi:GT2 family glycosyltransferase/glycosyltransferase involved in cell wall biosynthesis